MKDDLNYVSLLDYTGLLQIVLPANDEFRHPFWEFNWQDNLGGEVIACSIFLYLSGILCAAAGIGGGGVYVAVLMVLGKLTPRNAVPLSKAIVFFGSTSSLAVNLSRMYAAGGAKSRNVIDFYACRTVVPAALAGTFLGVLLNSDADDRHIVFLLVAVLSFMTYLVLREAWKQHCEEKYASKGEINPAVAEQAEKTPLLPPELRSTSAPEPCDSMEAAICSSSSSRPGAAKDPKMGVLSRSDCLAAFFMLVVVIMAGILRFHIVACDKEKRGAGPAGSCDHPIVMKLFGGRMEIWMRDTTIAFFLQLISTSTPIIICSAMAAYYGFHAMTQGGWNLRKVMQYQSVSVTTGVLAGLIGVGGGLILSPFFLVMGMDPAVAVGTSSTCVLFTSSSTTMQYVFTDRIIMPLAVVYGIVTFVASYSGTSLVHLLQDKFDGRKSYITLIVAVGVGLSAILSIVKFIRVLEQTGPDVTVVAATPALL